MDPATPAWILTPLVLLHLAMRRRRELLVFQVLVDVLLVLLPGRLVVRGWHLGPGAPGGPSWGGAATVAGSPEQIDVPLQFGVWWEEVRRLVASGEPPWISERLGGGTPLLANGQTHLPFPLHLPAWVLGAWRGTDVMVFWKLELGALGAFLMLRRWRLRAVAAAAGALAFGFGLYPLSWVVVPLAWVVAAMPWAMWALVGALRGDRRCSAVLAAVLGVMAGWSVHPETAGFLWLAVGSAGVMLAWGRVRRLRRLVVPFLWRSPWQVSTPCRPPSRFATPPSWLACRPSPTTLSRSWTGTFERTWPPSWRCRGGTGIRQTALCAGHSRPPPPVQGWERGRSRFHNERRPPQARPRYPRRFATASAQ